MTFFRCSLIVVLLSLSAIHAQVRGRTRPNPVLFQLGSYILLIVQIVRSLKVKSKHLLIFVTILSTGKHDVHWDKITLSGFSSGGTFAQQMLVAYSSLFAGIASFSHGMNKLYYYFS
jgi:predicted esterase